MLTPSEHLAILLAVFFACSASMVAQTITVPSYRSPDISADGHVTLRSYAPGATSVELTSDVQQQNLPLQRDEQGVWAVTLGPLAPDYYSYAFIVDGVRVLDPKNTSLYPNLEHPSNVLHITGAEPQLWDIADVPHGVVHHHLYKSATVRDEQDFYVYTPPRYEKGKQHYPVLYLLHGFTDDASAWLAVGKANVIFDNLLAQGRIQPMVVVMPLGYGQPELLQVGLESPRTDDLWNENTRRYHDMLLNEVMPLAESTYRTSKKREEHAIAGLSMGGTESLYVGLNTPEKFAWIGGFSSAVQRSDFAAEFPVPGAGKNQQIRLLWMACGVDDRLYKANRRLVEYLQTSGGKPVFVETPGAHTWLVWRRNLIAFAPLLFQKR
jgi:enterochelin esterase family protein